jgi:hypothetical protein
MSRFFLLLFVAAIGLTSTASAQESVYLVENVIVDFKGKSPTEARAAGVAGARREAFAILAARLNLDATITANVNDDGIADMVKSEQINDEKLAGNRYSAVLTIEFAADFVEHFLKQQNTKETATAKVEGILIIPGKIEGNRLILWEEDNGWKKALENAASYANKNFVIPESDSENVSTITSANIAQLNANSLGTMMDRYSSKIAFIAIFSYDAIENKAIIDVDEIRDGQKTKSKLNFINVNNLSSDDLMFKVAQKTIDHFSKLQNTSYSKVSNLVNIEIISDRLSNWIAIKNKIEDSNLVNQLNIESISQDRIKISLNYIRPEINIIEAFDKMGIPLRQTGRNSYLIFLK